MAKAQKIWLWIFIAMFVVPEILFFTSPLIFKSINGESFYSLYSPFISYELFFKHPVYLLVIIFIEWIGVLGLLILNFKNQKKKIALLFFIILLWLSYILCISYITGISINF